MNFTLCLHCDHFVESNDCRDALPPGDPERDRLCKFVHLEDGEQEFDHDAEPGPQTMSDTAWANKRPDLFHEYTDAVGPNSVFHSRRGKADNIEWSRERRSR